MSLFRLDASIRVKGSHSRARQLRREAEVQARRHGRELGAAAVTTAAKAA